MIYKLQRTKLKFSQSFSLSLPCTVDLWNILLEYTLEHSNQVNYFFIVIDSIMNGFDFSVQCRVSCVVQRGIVPYIHSTYFDRNEYMQSQILND